MFSFCSCALDKKSLETVAAQEGWFAFPGMFLDSYATQGPPTTWDNNQYGAPNQPASFHQENQGGLIDPNGQIGFIPPQNHGGMNIQNNLGSSTQNMAQMGLGNLNQGPADHQGLLHPQTHYPQQWQTGLQANQNPVVSGSSGGMVLTQGSNIPTPTQTVPPTSPPPDPVSTSSGPSQDQWSSNGQRFDPQLSPAVDQNTWQDPLPGPPPMDNLQTPQHQRQNHVDTNSHLVSGTDQQNFYPTHQGVELTQGQHTFQAPAHDNVSLNSSHTDSHAHIDSSAVQHYIMPPGGGHNVNVWPMISKGAIPMHPEAKADWIRYMREAAMRFYGQYPNYPQPTWKHIPHHQSGDKGIPEYPVQTQNWVDGNATTGTKEDTVPAQGSQASLTMLSVPRSKESMPLQHSGNSLSKKAQLKVPVHGHSVPDLSSAISTTTSSNTHAKRDITTTSSAINNLIPHSTVWNTATTSPPPEQGTASSDTGVHPLTPHKNMTNAELHKIIRILLIPHKLKRLAKAKTVTSHQPPIGHTRHQATITAVRQPSQPLTQPGHHRRPLSEMHIKMVNFAPSPLRIFTPAISGLSAANAHPSLAHPHPRSLSEIHVKLINYDQNIVDTFNSHVSPPRSRLTQPKWVSAKVHPSPNQSASPTSISYPSSPKRSSINISTNSSKTHVDPHMVTRGKPKVSLPPGIVQQKQKDVKNHQKAVVRHTQMLHHVMSSLAREMNRFQGSVRQSRAHATHNTDTAIQSGRQRTVDHTDVLQSLNSTKTNARGTAIVSPGSISGSGTQYNTKVSMPLMLNKDTSRDKSTVAENWKPNPKSILPSRSIPDLALSELSNMNTNIDATSAASSSSASPYELNQESTTIPPAPIALIPSTSNAENQQQHITGITELKITDISPSSLTGEHGTEKTQQSNKMLDTTSHVFSNSEQPNIKVSDFYPHPNGTSETASVTQKPVMTGGDVVVPETLTTSKPVIYEQSPETTTPQPVSELFTTHLSVTTDTYPEVNQEVLNQQLVKQLGKLEQLHHRQQIVEKKQQLKDQHDRLKKQRDLLQQQLVTLRKLRGADPGTSLPAGLSGTSLPAGPSDTPLAIPESPAGLAALLSGLQMNF